MHQCMRFQSCCCSEFRVTFVTFKRPASVISMNFPMSVKCRFVCKLFVTYVTFMFFSSVYTTMFFQIGFCFESYTTEVTFEWFFMSVNMSMDFQIQHSLENISTSDTFKGVIHDLKLGFSWVFHQIDYLRFHG